MTSDLFSKSSIDTPPSVSSSSLSSELLPDSLFFFCCLPLCLCFFCFFLCSEKKENQFLWEEPAVFCIFSTFLSFLCLCCFLSLCFFSLLLLLGFSSSSGQQTEAAPPLSEQGNNMHPLQMCTQPSAVYRNNVKHVTGVGFRSRTF